MCRMSATRTCRLCGREFDPVRGNQVFCTRACGETARAAANRERMRAARGSFAPRPCADCGVAIIGRALRCPDCRREDAKRRQRDYHAREAVRARVNQQRAQRRRDDPDWARREDARKWEAIKNDPDRYAAYRELRREYDRKRAARLRAEREAAALERLAEMTPGPPKPPPPKPRCKWCGAEFDRRAVGLARYCCREHSEEGRRETMRRVHERERKPPRPCVDCGVTVPARRKRCPECARRKRRQDARGKLSDRQRANALMRTDPARAAAMLDRLRERERRYAAAQRAKRRERKNASDNHENRTSDRNHGGD